MVDLGYYHADEDGYNAFDGNADTSEDNAS
jgi:hypothetical protein